MWKFLPAIVVALVLFLSESRGDPISQFIKKRISSNDSGNNIEDSLVLLLMNINVVGLKGCSLTLIIDDFYRSSSVFTSLLVEPNVKQIVRLRSVQDFDVVQWKIGFCRAYLILLQNLDPLLQFGGKQMEKWDYNGRYVIVSKSKGKLEMFTASAKGRKTKNILCLIQSKKNGKWSLYTNNFYWRSGLVGLGLAVDKKVIYFPDKLKNLERTPLKIVTFQWQPSVFNALTSGPSGNRYYGIDIEIVKSLAQAMNFKAEFKEPPKGEYWGSETSNGSWTGMIGQLLTNEGDIGIADVFLSQDRAAVVDFSVPYDMEATCFLARVAPNLPLWHSLLLPFKLSVWITICFSILFCGIMLCIFIESPKRFIECLMVSIQAHLKIQSKFISVKNSTKVFLIAVWLYCMILTIAYSSNLTAFLTVSRPPSTFETIQELRDAKDVAILGVSAFFRNVLSSSGEEKINSLTSRFEVFDKETDIFKAILQGKGVYLQNQNYVQYSLVTKCGPLGRIMKECFAPFGIAMTLQKNSPLTAKINDVVQQIVQSGLVHKWFSDSLQRAKKEQANLNSAQVVDKSEKSNTVEERNVSLTLNHLQGLFFILVAVYPIACLIFLSEYLATKLAL